MAARRDTRRADPDLLTMPTAPPHYCAAPGCSTLVPRGTARCPVHRREQDVQRGTAHQRGYTKAWARYSADRLTAHPYCVGYPRGVHALRTRACVTDHIVSAQTAPDRFWDVSNHQSLCYACNARKAFDEARGLAR